MDETSMGKSCFIPKDLSFLDCKNVAVLLGPAVAAGNVGIQSYHFV